MIHWPSGVNDGIESVPGSAWLPGSVSCRAPWASWIHRLPALA